MTAGAPHNNPIKSYNVQETYVALGFLLLLCPITSDECRGYLTQNKETAFRMWSTIGTVFRFAFGAGLANNEPTFALRDVLIIPKVKLRATITEANTFGGIMRGVDG